MSENGSLRNFRPIWLILVWLLGLSLSTNAQAPFSQYILAPSSRTLYAVKVYNVNGTIANAESLLNPTGDAEFDGVSAVTFDFGKNIAGFPSVTVGNSSSTDVAIALAYSESSEWISGLSSDATRGGVDQLYWLQVGQGAGTYKVDKDHERGGFRYLSLISNTSAVIHVTSVSVEYTAAPQQDLQNYTGYFHSNDELLNRIWYSGAYTTQLCTINPTRGDAIIGPYPASIDRPGELSLTAWFSNYTITNGASCLVDGPKRDVSELPLIRSRLPITNWLTLLQRLVWPGDMAIAVPTIFVSTNDMYSIRNSLEALFALQTADGMLPYASKPLGSTTSFTYHLYNLIGVYLDYLYTADETYLRGVWDKFKLGVQWSLNSVDSSGLMNVTSSADWLRDGMGGHNIEANAILYYLLQRGLELASILNDTTVVSNWTSTAEGVKTAANNLLWVPADNLYRDNENTALTPQDGNSWAIKSNLTTSASQAAAISTALQARWGTYGAPAPEAGGGKIISPFIGGFEVESHFLVGQPQRAIDLIRLEWGYMLDGPHMTNSTFIEGYSTDGSRHYVYSNDQRVSHAHGWSTGPTSLMTFYVAGLRITSAVGETWVVEPALGDLTKAEAGFLTSLGRFAVDVEANDGVVSALEVQAADGTLGTVILKGVKGKLVSSDGSEVALNEEGVAEGVKGGTWVLKIE